MTDGVNTPRPRTSVVVNEVAAGDPDRERPSPTIKAESSTISLTALVTDPDPLATDQVAWTVTTPWEHDRQRHRYEHLVPE